MNDEQSNEIDSDREKSKCGEIVQSPYDRLLNRTLMQTESAQELIRLHLPSEFVQYLKLESLQQADTSFIDANLKRRFADRLFSVELSDEWVLRKELSSREVFLLILVDHKSSPDKNAVVQLLGYIVRIWEHRIENQLPLVPVIPWVIYNGVRPWTVAKSLHDLMPVPEAWKRHVPDLELTILDVSRMSDSDMSEEPILHVTLMLLKYGREPDLEARLRPVLREVADQFRGVWVANLLDTMRKYIMSVNPEVGEDKVNNLFYEFWPVKPEPGSVADQLLTKGRQEGWQEGRQEGEIKLIRALESILGLAPTGEDLSSRSLEELQRITESLQLQIQKRRT